MKNKILIAAISLFVLPHVYAYGELKPMSDAEIRQHILDGLLKSYEQECPCPFSKDEKGKLCGDDSEYFRSRGRVICYTQDISDGDIGAYRQKYSIIDPKSDPNYQYTSPYNYYKQPEEPSAPSTTEQSGQEISR